MSTNPGDLFLGTHPVFDRPHLAELNLLEGNLPAVARSLMAPDTLTPAERETAASRWGIKGTILEGLVNITSNPLVILGAVGSILLGSPKLVDMGLMKLGRAAAPRFTRFIAPYLELVKDTPLARLLPGANRQGLRMMVPAAEELAGHIQTAQKALGRAVTDDELALMAMNYERTADPTAHWWRTGGRIAESMGESETFERLRTNLVEVQEKIDSAWAKAPAPLHTLQKGYSEWHKKVYTTNHGDPEIAEYLYRNLRNARDVPVGTPTEVDKYLPHLWLRDPTSMTVQQAEAEAAKQMIDTSRELRQGSPSALHRRAALLPDPEMLAKYGLSEENALSMAALTAQDSAGIPGFYSLNFRPTMVKYLHRLYVTHAFSVPARETPLYVLGKREIPAAVLTKKDWREQDFRLLLEQFYERPEQALAEGMSAPTAMRTAEIVATPEQLLARAGALFKTEEPNLVLEGHKSARKAINTYEDQGRLDLAQRAHEAYAELFPEVREGILHRESFGEQINNELQRLVNLKNPYWNSVVSEARNVVLPQMMGGYSPKQLESMQKWRGHMETAAHHFESLADKVPFGGDLLRKAATKLRTTPLTWSQAGHEITRYLTTSTLGGNLYSTFTNSMQYMANQGALMSPRIAIGAQANALKQGVSLINRMLPKSMGGLGEEFGVALRHVNPEFAKMQLQLDPGLARIAETELGGVMQRLGGSKAKLIADKIQDALMFPFKSSELINRIAAFDSARTTLMKELPSSQFFLASRGKWTRMPKPGEPGMNPALLEEAASEGAAEFMGQTQFGGGPLQRPTGILNWWMPFSQYLTFPMRQLNFLVQATKNPAAFSRLMLMAGGIYGVTREVFGADSSRGLVFGGMPQLTENTPFAPLPVPPFLQLVGSTMMALGGNGESLRRSLPLLVPGGVPASRLVSAMPGGQPIAQAIGRRYADYNNALPDGRVPVYTDKGSLVGYFTKTQLYTQALGLLDAGQQQETALTKFAVTQRDQIRQYKRDYLDALYMNDARTAMSIQDEWSKRYPGLGPIPVKKSDYAALHMRHDITRLERVMETLPPDLRPQFEKSIATLFGASYPAVMGLQPPGLQAGNTIVLREPYRLHTAAGTQQRVEQSMHGMKLQDRLLSEAEETASALTPATWFPPTEEAAP